MTERLRELYYRPESGLAYMGANKLYRAARAQQIPVTQKQVRDFIRDQEVAQLHKPVTEPKIFLPFKSPAPNYILQADLMFMDPDYAQLNSGYHIILCVVDVYTRYAWTAPLKDKRAATVLVALQPILTSAKPTVIQFDGGSEFKSVVSSWVTSQGIRMEFHTPGDHRANAIVERFNQTLRLKLEQHMTATKSKNWASALASITRGYNHSYHSGIRSEPAHASSVDIELSRAAQSRAASASDLVVGDRVRTLRNPVAFEKGAVPKWSIGTHDIEEISGARGRISGKWHRLYLLQKANVVETAPLSASASSSAAALKDQGKQKRALSREGID
ncbi:MAG: DDE-type integrase/transposase/recombinase, partial [Candidatus Pacebacteria bacterium]|nr:DDE-type integrase/transposase/recombinase [Candidatus Paceibacterota bacterium]